MSNLYKNRLDRDEYAFAHGEMMIGDGCVDYDVPGHDEGSRQHYTNYQFIGTIMRLCDYQVYTFTNCSFENAILAFNVFSGCKFINCNFGATRIYGSTFANCKFEDCRFYMTIDVGSKITNSTFSNCEFYKTNIEDATNRGEKNKWM